MGGLRGCLLLGLSVRRWALYALGVSVVGCTGVWGVWVVGVDRPSTRQLLSNFWGQFFRRAWAILGARVKNGLFIKKGVVQRKINSTKLYSDCIPYKNNLVEMLLVTQPGIFFHVIQDHYNDIGVILHNHFTIILSHFCRGSYQNYESK